ncbi:MAG UNVERIFIED_CONTAM: class I SAM-dependent methyltransferase [Planctomycetaceae bacterium]
MVGFDLSWKCSPAARERLIFPAPVFVAGSTAALPFRDNTFDCVTCGYVLEHLPDPAMDSANSPESLRPGGVVLLLATEDSFSGLLTSHT